MVPRYCGGPLHGFALFHTSWNKNCTNHYFHILGLGRLPWAQKKTWSWAVGSLPWREPAPSDLDTVSSAFSSRCRQSHSLHNNTVLEAPSETSWRALQDKQRLQTIISLPSFSPMLLPWAGLSQGSKNVALAWPKATSGTHQFILCESKQLNDARCKPTAVLYYSNSSAFLFNSSLHLLFPFPKSKGYLQQAGSHYVTNTFAFPLLPRPAILTGTKAQISPFRSQG